MLYQSEKILDFEKYEISDVSLLGVSSTKRMIGLMDAHTHEECFELLYHVSGGQNYIVGGRQFNLVSRQILIIRPRELHGNATFIGPSPVYYSLLFRLPPFAKRFLGMPEEETAKIKEFIYGEQRLYGMDYDLRPLLDGLFRVAQDKSELKTSQLQGLLVQLFVAVYNNISKARKSLPPCIREFIRYTGQYFGDEFDLAAWVETQGVTESTFKRLFLEHIGLGVGVYMRVKRMDYAEQLLRGSEKSITDIAMELGFSSSQHFATMYKKHKNITPSQYRRYSKAEGLKTNPQPIEHYLMNRDPKI